MDPVIISLTIIIIIIGVVGIIIGIFLHFFFEGKGKTIVCPKCKSSNTFPLKTTKYCNICDKNISVFKCKNCNNKFLECGHMILDSNFKK
ncbi:MAG: hypothetical protein ACTSPY_05235 [Candidatus Helarchaeota archaeon]